MTTTTVTFPSNPDELAEFLADDKRSGDAFKDEASRKDFILNYQKAFNKADKGDLARQIADATQAGITSAIREMKDNLGLPGGVTHDTTTVDFPSRGTGAQRAAAPRRGVLANQLDGKFSSLGEFASTIDVKNISTGGQRNADKLELVRRVQNAYSSFDPASAGFLIPEEFRSDIMGLVLESAIVRPRATVIPMGTQTVSIPFVDETTHVGSVYGGMVFSWTAEGGSISPSEAKFGRIRLEANKLTGGARIPNELMADAPALTAFLNAKVPQGIAFYEDNAFLNGDGGMQPLGVYNSTAMVTVSKETGQAADTLLFDNITKMYARMLPSSLGSAVWLVNQNTIPQLLSLSIAVGTGGSALMVANLQDAPNLSILGRPVIVTEKAATIGDLNDIAFVDLSYYLIGDRMNLTMESSEHSRFMSDETEFRVIERADGRPWVQSALTPLNGSTVSPFVNLQAR